VSSVPCVVGENTWEARRTAENSIIVLFIISSLNFIGYQPDSAFLSYTQLTMPTIVSGCR
ncbi:hypothetical protein ACVGWL_07135, partial [Enterobacter asburiae]